MTEPLFSTERHFAVNKSDELWSRKDIIDLVGKLTAVAVFLFAIVEYFQLHSRNSEHERMLQSHRAVVEWHHSDTSKFLLNLGLRIAPYQRYYRLNEPGSISDEKFSLIFESVVFGAEDAPPMLSEFIRAVDYFESLYFCVEAGVCDKEIVFRYFCPKLENFDTQSRRFVSGMRKYVGQDQFARSLANFLRDCKQGYSEV